MALGLQNRDGGIPTFCRGWGAFDRSSPDITAHALRARAAWRNDLPPAMSRRVDRAAARALG
jgi:squalene-hopene/tetraprenyl-beta-curcumene cyclase